jgi:uncharacterized protein
MTSNKDVVQRYLEGFRRMDRAAILECLCEDFTWVLHGHRSTQGKAAFAAEINDDFFEGRPVIEIERMVEEGDEIAITGHGVVTKQGGETAKFVFSEVFVFSQRRIHRLETFHVWT